MGPEALGGGYSDILSIFNDFLRRGMSSLLVADRDGSHVRGLRRCKFGLMHVLKFYALLLIFAPCNGTQCARSTPSIMTKQIGTVKDKDSTVILV